MAQHIGMILEDEDGKLIKDSKLNFQDVLDKCDVSDNEWLGTIDEYGNTVFNNIQIPIIINELKELPVEEENYTLINKFIKFLEQAEDHEYIKFIGD